MKKHFNINNRIVPSRFYKKTTSKKPIHKIAIIFPYYEVRNCNRNQTNLSYFLKYALNKTKWKNMNITILFIINGRQCEVLIPEKKDIIVWKRDYHDECNLDIYRLGIGYFEKKFKKKFYNMFNNLFIIDSNCFGPIYKQNRYKHWLDPFLNKIKEEKSVMCRHKNIPCLLIKINKSIYNLILYKKNKTKSWRALTLNLLNKDYKISHCNTQSDLFIKNTILKNMKKSDILYLYENLNFKNIYCLENENKEGSVLWPQQNKNNKSVVIYCHYDEDLLIKDYVIQSLKTLIILEYDIIFCTTSSQINNIDLPFKIHYFKNKQNMTAGNDIIMLQHILNSVNLDKYEWVKFLNDSIMLPIHGLDNMRDTIKKYRSKNDFWGLYLSNEKQNHLCSCHIEFKKTCIPKLKEFLNTAFDILKLETKSEIINSIEVKLTRYLANCNFIYDGVVKYSELKKAHCIMFNPINVYTYISRKEVFGIKWKYIGNYINLDRINNPCLNYLMRYLKMNEDIIPQIPCLF